MSRPPAPFKAAVTLPEEVSPQELARYAIGLANARGGLIRVGPDGAANALPHPLELTHAIFELSGGRLSVNVTRAEDAPGGLLVHVPQAAYVLASPDGEVLAWDGARLAPLQARPEEAAPPPDYTASVPPDASLADLDPLEVARLRSLGRSGPYSALPDLDFLRELGLIVEQVGVWRPNVAGILLAGTPAALRAHVPQAEVNYFHHRTADSEFEFREDLLRPLPALLLRLSELIQARNSFTPVQVGLFRIEVWDFDEAVYREALLNALTHRDYTLRDVVHVHHHPDRLEVANPGGFAGGVTRENILRHQPKRRNPLLAEGLAKLGLVERAGVGVDKMYQLMLRHGKEPPEYTTYPDAVSLTLLGPGFDAAFVRFVARIQEEMQTLSLDMLIVLSRLGREREASRAELAHALQLPEDRTPRLLTLMEERGLIESSGRGERRLYALSERSRTALGGGQSGRGSSAQRPRAVADPREVALGLAARPEGVGNADLREACGLNTQQAWRVLRALVLAGALTRRGQGRRGARYHSPDEGRRQTCLST